MDLLLAGWRDPGGRLRPRTAKDRTQSSETNPSEPEVVAIQCPGSDGSCLETFSGNALPDRLRPLATHPAKRAPARVCGASGREPSKARCRLNQYFGRIGWTELPFGRDGECELQ